MGEPVYHRTRVLVTKHILDDAARRPSVPITLLVFREPVQTPLAVGVTKVLVVLVEDNDVKQ